MKLFIWFFGLWIFAVAVAGGLWVWHRHEAVEISSRNAKYSTLVYTPCSDTCDWREIMTAQQQDRFGNVSRRIECVRDVQFLPTAKSVAIAYTSNIGVRTVVQASLVDSPTLVRNGTERVNGKSEWCEP